MASSHQSAAARSIAAGIPPASNTVLSRWAAFNAIGVAGMALQLATLAILVRLLHVHYAIATALAVEAAILHNFAWHQRWTWRDRPVRRRRDSLVRLGRFHLLNGSVSLIGNVALTTLFARLMGWDPVASNVVAIGACSLVNFAASDSLVFALATAEERPGPSRPSRILSLVVLSTFIGVPIVNAGPSPSTVAGWQA